MDLCKSLVKSAFLALFISAAPIVSAQHHNPHSDTALSEIDKINPNSDDTTEELDYFGSFVFHHISDDYMFHIVGETYFHLPVVIYEPGKGFDVFSSGRLNEPDHETHLVNGKYYYHHGKLVIAEIDEHGHAKMDSTGHHPVGKHEAKVGDLITGSKDVFYNFSITKNVFAILLACTLMLIIFISVARAYKRNPGSAPRGLQSFMEPLILYVQDEVVKPSIGRKYEKFLPYMLTLFFFIWINNMIGLIPIFPGSANVTGNIAVTFTLALLALILQVINANRHFWAHIFWFPGVPVPVKILLAVIEFIGLFTKPFSLMIRLFANITAGHIIIMSIIGISFVMKNVYLGIATSIFSVAMFTLELLVAAIQAYIFTLLTSLMIGSAVEEGHGHEHEAAHH
jgi:F-type H+-transporting ATPase subunit a